MNAAVRRGLARRALLAAYAGAAAVAALACAASGRWNNLLVFRSSYLNLVAALIVLAFLALERGRPAAAAIAIAVGASVKLFPLAALSFAALHRGRARFAALLCAALAAAVALPLPVTGAGGLAAQYASWYRVELADALQRGASAMWLLHRWGGVAWPSWPVQLAATALLVATAALLGRRPAGPQLRLRFLASVLVYTVLFNHQAERPSFVLALTGVAVWWSVAPRSALRSALAAASYALVVPMNAAEAAPGLVPDGADPIALAVLPLALTWGAMQAELLGAALSRDPAGEPARRRAADPLRAPGTGSP
jgi:hypothetical protein